MRFITLHRKKKNLKDEELLCDFRKNKDQEILGELYSRYMHLIYGVCLKYFKDAEKSQDAVILIYEKIQKDIHRYTINNFKNWIYVLTKNYCLMELRKSKPGVIVFTSNDEELAGFMEKSAELHPIDEAQNEKLEKMLIHCIEKLKDEQKKCISLFYFEHKCYREISKILELEEKRVKSFIQNGKRNLKICLESNK